MDAVFRKGLKEAEELYQAYTKAGIRDMSMGWKQNNVFYVKILSLKKNIIVILSMYVSSGWLRLQVFHYLLIPYPC